MNSKLIVDSATTAVIQFIILAGLPFLGYFIYQRRQYYRSFSDTLKRAGLQRCPGRYLASSIAFAVVGVIIGVSWPPPPEPLTRRGSMYREFAGLGLTMRAIVAAILYGAVQTGLTEEILFRGLIAGRLSRRLPIAWANFWQAVIFFLPHCLILLVAPEMWGPLPLVFAVMLFWLGADQVRFDHWTVADACVRERGDGLERCHSHRGLIMQVAQQGAAATRGR